MKRSGFTIIELIVVIMIIGVLGTIGYKNYIEVTLESKAMSVASDIEKVKTAISNTLAQTGNYYQHNSYAPHKIDDIEADYANTHNFFSDGQPDASRIGAQTETALYDSLIEMGFKYEDPSIDATTATFRLPSFPMAKVFFPLENNGVRAIRIEGINGELALKVREALNDTPSPSTADGTVTEKPVFISNSIDKSEGDLSTNDICAGTHAGTDLGPIEGRNCFLGSAGASASGSYGQIDSLFSTNVTDAAMVESFSEQDVEKIKQQAKVNLYYVYEFGGGW
jgi:prepilin-type N-terminal cleavage/methylation domain-containing protein